MYKLSIAKIQIMSNDFTHVEYLSEKQLERIKQAQAPVASSAKDVLSFLYKK